MRLPSRKLDKNGLFARESEWTTTTKTHVKGDMNWSVIKDYAVNGAVHYACVIMEYTSLDAVMAIGVNGYMRDGHPVYEHRAYWVSRDNGNVPKHMTAFDGFGVKRLDLEWQLFSQENVADLRDYVNGLMLTDEEREVAKRRLEAELESRVKRIHQRLYDSDDMRNLLSTNEKLYLFCALIMAGLPAKGITPLSESDLHGNTLDGKNDGIDVLGQVKAFLIARGNKPDKVNSVCDLLRPTLTNKSMWHPRGESRESLIKTLFRQVSEEVLPYLTTNLRLDFTGKILNSLNDWVQIENDKRNDVVLTPRFVCNLMARLARTNRDSFVWENCTTSLIRIAAA